jgi:RNA-splicing ligase RtcB
LATSIQQTLEFVAEFKHGLFSERVSCADVFREYAGVVNAPVYDVTGQPASIQGAYGLYRQAIAYAAGSHLAVFNDFCKGGGRKVSDSDVQDAKREMDKVLSYLDQANGLLK